MKSVELNRKEDGIIPREVSSLNGQLPFGCHAWNIPGTEYWRLIFAQYGYQL